MRYIGLFALIILLSGCKKEALNEVEVNNQYKIMVPAFTKEVAHLSPAASLQYADANNEFCLMVIDDSKEDFQDILYAGNLQDEFPNTIDGLTTYLQRVQEEVVGDAGEVHYSDITSLQINGFDARQYTIHAVIDGQELYYLYTIVDGDAYYYQILSWTMAHKKGEYQELFTKISQSFKEL